ncbi:uncharacterized protein LOC142999131 isoform X2 [Genypterus blacodes]|uniref:uncharacterized protein LOC142999131 isoform X2 n=1 Tax=Genypterus blacodes TaxID=154954 RepID=UPI003F771B17
MRPIALLLIVCLLHQGSFQGAVEKFVLRGEDVLLELQKPLPSEFDNFQWKTSTIIPPVVLVRPNSNPLINPSYSGRVEFSDQDFSLRLKNLQASDSGDFTAGCILSVFDLSEVISAKYKVTVQEPVSPVDLTVTSVSSSEDSCNLTVTCTTLGSHINTTFRCDNQTCYKEHETSEVTTTNSLEVYWSHGLIICNHSNQVSWTNKSMEVKPPCKSPVPLKSGSPVGLIVGIVFAVLAVCGGVCGRVYLYKKRGKYVEAAGDTVYADVMNNTRGESVNQNQVADSDTSIYSFAMRPLAPVPAERSSQAIREPSTPDTVYAQVKR